MKQYIRYITSTAIDLDRSKLELEHKQVTGLGKDW